MSDTGEAKNFDRSLDKIGSHNRIVTSFQLSQTLADEFIPSPLVSANEHRQRQKLGKY